MKISLPALLALALAAPTMAAADAPDSDPDLVELFEEYLEWEEDGAPGLGHPPTRERLERRRQALGTFQERLAELDGDQREPSREVDFLAVRARMDQQDFMLNHVRPWARDPGFYSDPLQRLAFTELPVEDEDDRDKLHDHLAAIPDWLELARDRLRDGAADYADLALHNLRQPDGVGHGHPYRETPPKGVIGWYRDFLERADDHQPELVEAGDRALAAIEEFADWLESARPDMEAQAGVGAEAFDWYLRQVALLPHDGDEVVNLARRELERTRAFYALERHRNRDLPELELPETEDEYLARIESVDRRIRAFLEAEDFITVPDHIPDDFREMGFNVPWIERPDGPNYWEQVQYRDPSPDHWHAVIPGHRFDGRMAATVDHPIRRHVSDAARIEGWALYVEEAPLQLGFYDEHPRTRELIYNFALFRAARTIGDVELQRNEMTADEAVEFWMEHTPWLDEDVARVDAEIYLRRPPGYGLSYTIGAFQLYRLLADRQRQLGDDFNLRDFHDHIMTAGRIPLSLLRYEMTGLDDEIRRLRDHVPLDEAGF